MTFYPIRKNNEGGFPFSEIENLQKEMNRLFDFSFPSLGQAGQLSQNAWVPALDVRDGTDEIVINADLPGLKKDDISVTLQDDVLTITGEKKKEDESKKDNLVRSERYYGKFSRAVALPSAVDAGKVDAVFQDGVLQIKLKKREDAKPRQININVK